MAGKGGGAWKVAYADFVTAMMAFFMVMWLISQGEDVKEAVASHFRDPRGLFTSGGALLPPVLGTFPAEMTAPSSDDDTKNKKRTSGAAKPSSTTAFATNRGERTRMGTVILYDEDTADLTEEGQPEARRTGSVAGRQAAEDRNPRPCLPTTLGTGLSVPGRLATVLHAVRRHAEVPGGARDSRRTHPAQPGRPLRTIHHQCRSCSGCDTTPAWRSSCWRR